MGDQLKACPSCAEQIQAAAVVCRFCKYDFRAGAAPLPRKKMSGVAIALIVGVVLFGGIFVIAIVAAIAIPGLLSAQRASNERNASASLKTLCTAEADFRSNDRDNDRAQNFWVRDVYGLFALSPSTNGSGVPRGDAYTAIKLIEPSLAGADATGVEPHEACAPMSSMVNAWGPKANYVYRTFTSFEAGPQTSPYGAEGGIPAFGPAYNFGKFGFMAMPLNASAGRRIFIVSEDITLYAGTVESGYSATYSGGSERKATFDWSGAAMGGRPFTKATPFPDSPSRGWQKLD